MNGKKNITHQKKRDAIIVFGAAVRPNGSPSPALRRRLLHGVSLIKTDKANFLLVTGGLGEYPPTEAEVMKRIAIKEGVPIERIIVEEDSKTTFESVLNCARILRSNKWKCVIAVSDSYHVYRTKYLLGRLGFDVSGDPAIGGREANGEFRWACYYFREFAALIWNLILLTFINKQEI